jgi:hypothetical protein
MEEAPISIKKGNVRKKVEVDRSKLPDGISRWARNGFISFVANKVGGPHVEKEEKAEEVK